MCAGRRRSFWTKKEPLKYKLWFHVHSRGSPNVSIHSKNHWFVLNMLFNGSDFDLSFQITLRMWRSKICEDLIVLATTNWGHRISQTAKGKSNVYLPNLSTALISRVLGMM